MGDIIPPDANSGARTARNINLSVRSLLSAIEPLIASGGLYSEVIRGWKKESHFAGVYWGLSVFNIEFAV